MEQAILGYFPSTDKEDDTLFKAAEEFAYDACDTHKIDGDNTNMPRVNRAVSTARWINHRGNIATIETWYKIMMFLCFAAFTCYMQPQSIIWITTTLPVIFLIMPHPMSKSELRIIHLATMLHNIRHTDYCDSLKECNMAIKNWLSENILNEGERYAINEILDALVRGDKYSGRWWRAYHHVRTASLIEDYNAERKYISCVQRYSGFTSDACWERVNESFELKVLKYKNTIELYYVRDIINMLHENAIIDVETHEVIIERDRAAAKAKAAADAAKALAKSAPKASEWD